MSAVTSQPLPFDRLEREKHIQAIFRAFRNRCGPTCQCQLPSPRLTSSNQTPAPDWESETRSSPAPLLTTNSSQVERRWPTAGRRFLSTLQAADKIEITARPEVQGEPELLCLFTNFNSLKGEMYHRRATVCSPEDLQHCNRRRRTTVICGCGRYSSLLSCRNVHLTQWFHKKVNTKCSLCSHSCLDLFFFLPVRKLMRVSPVLWSSPCLLFAGIRLPGPPGLLFWKAPEGGCLLRGLLSDGNECLHTTKTSHRRCETEVGGFLSLCLTPVRSVSLFEGETEQHDTTVCTSRESMERRDTCGPLNGKLLYCGKFCVFHEQFSSCAQLGLTWQRFWWSSEYKYSQLC